MTTCRNQATTSVETEAGPLGTIRRDCHSLRLAREASREPGQWRITVTAISLDDDERLGAVLVSPGESPAPTWQPEPFTVGIIVGAFVASGIVDTCEAIVDAILNGTDLDARHGFKQAPDCPYPIPMLPQEAVAWISSG